MIAFEKASKYGGKTLDEVALSCLGSANYTETILEQPRSSKV